MLRDKNAGLKPVLLLAVLCVTVSLFSSAFAAGSHALTPSVESLVVGGSDCSDFMDGFAVGMGISYGVVQMMKHGHLQILLPTPVLVGIFIVTALMCLWSSVLSIYKVTRIDPALVFKS